MEVGEHLLELRARLVQAVIAVALGAVAGWFLYPAVSEALLSPLFEFAREHPTRIVTVDLAPMASELALRVRVSCYLGVLVSSPVWLYQLWAFIVPGPTGREKRRSMSLVAAAVPLLLGGVAVAWLVLPDAVMSLTGSPRDDTVTLLAADDYLTFVLRLMTAFATAFVLPLLIVALNLAPPDGTAGPGRAASLSP